MKSLTLSLLILGSISLIYAQSNCTGIQAWNGNCVTYKLNDKVTYNGNLYQNCGCQGVPGGNNSCWQLLGSCTVQNTCDTAQLWSSTTTYSINQYVRYAGRLFRSYCDGNKGKYPQFDQSAWAPISSCNVCEQAYNVNHYYYDNWRTVQPDKTVYRAKWYVGPQCPPGTNQVWVSDGKCGCNDPTQFNYDSTATYNDGSCIPKIVGCMTPGQFNYNPLANTPATCIPVITGCMTPGQFNYNPNANTPDTCIPVITGCMTPGQFNYNPLANTPDTCIPVITGCMTPGQFNYNPNANTPDTCIPVITGCMTPGQFNYNPLANTPDTCIPVITGCMTPGQFNYNPNANTAGTCIPVKVGCLDPTATNYDSSANTSGTCTYSVPGCTDPKATNYNPLATVDNGCCQYPTPVYGCTDPTATNYDSLATIDNGCCQYPIQVSGCTDSKATNYNPLATVDNGCCEYPPQIYGCTNSEAKNYDPKATVSVDCCVFDQNRPNQGCASPAWTATGSYTPYQVVTHNGRAWRLKNWGTITGASNEPGQNVWGAWDLFLQCSALPNCCSAAAFSSSKHYWVGDCAFQNFDGKNRFFRAQSNTSGTAPRWACGPTNIWSTEVNCA